MIPNRENLKIRLNDITAGELKKIISELKKIAVEEELQIGGKEIPFLKIPLIIEERIFFQVKESLNVFLDALLKLEKYAFKNEGKHIYDRLMASLTPGGRTLVEQCIFESEYSLIRRQRRFDGFLDDKSGTYKIIEVNQAAPLAIHYHDTGQKLAAHMLSELGFDYEPQLLSFHILDWFIGEYQERFRKNMPDTIALVIEHGYPPKFTDLPRMAKTCERLSQEKYGHNLKIITCFPYELKLANSKVFYNRIPIDMIWRNSVYMTSYREQGIDIKDYETICSNPDKYLLINSSRTWLTRTKEVFAILSDDKILDELKFSDKEKNHIKKLIPRSYNLARNREANKEILKNRKAWISKPTDSGFGKGVEFGENHTELSWDNLISERSKDGYVFQERIRYPEKRITDITDNGESVERLVQFDFCPHHVNGSFTGTSLVRANIDINCEDDSTTMNLASGGFLLPLVIEGKNDQS